MALCNNNIAKNGPFGNAFLKRFALPAGPAGDMMLRYRRQGSMSNEDSLLSQYADAGNFNARVRLSQFSTNGYAWTSWVFDRIAFPPRAQVLELGCGPGYLWAGNLRRLPQDATVLLTDFSAGMLEEARKTLGVMAGFFRYAVVNAQEIPYMDSSFDIVIANHMLYHVPDRRKALSEISRALKPEGAFYATTIGRNNLSEIRELLRACFSLPERPARTVADAFGLENGEEQLCELFGEVCLERYENSLEVTEAAPIAEYILSGRGRVAEYLTPERRRQFEDYVQNIIDRDGSIHVTKESGMFIAKGRR